MLQNHYQKNTYDKSHSIKKKNADFILSKRLKDSFLIKQI